MNSTVRLTMLALMAAAAGCVAQAPTRHGEDLRELLSRDWAYWMEQAPEAATAFGVPGHDARWTDYSPEAVAARAAHLRETLDRLTRVDTTTLSAADRLNYGLYKSMIQTAIDGLAFDNDPFPVPNVVPHNLAMPINQMEGVQTDIPRIISLMPAATVADYEHLVARLQTAPALIDQTIAWMRKGLEQGKTPPRITMRDVPAQVTGQIVADPMASPLLAAFKSFPATIGDADRTRLAAAAASAYTSVLKPAFARLHDFLVETYIPRCRETTAAADLPKGAEMYAYNVRWHTTTNTTPADIHALGLAEVTRIRAAMDAIIAKVGFTGGFDAFKTYLRTNPAFFYKDADALESGYRLIAKRADPELAHLFGTLPRTPYGIRRVPDAIAPSQTTAYYEPGALTAGRPGAMFVNTYKLDARPKWEMEALTLHEAVPGHHIQIAIAQELPEMPDFRRNLSYTAFVEGWALYSESLGEEMGFYQDPYSKFGQLTYEMWRAVRLVVDTGLHSMGWTRQQAIEYFQQNAAKTLQDITVEVDRYIVWPGQSLGYKMGQLKIRALRTDAERAMGDRFDERAFHDVVLGQGAVPMDVAGSARQELEREVSPRQVVVVAGVLALSAGVWTVGGQAAQGRAPAGAPVNWLMPVPQSVTLAAGRVPISTATTVALRGFADERLHAAVQRMMRRLESRTGYTMSRALATDPAAATFVVDCAGPGENLPSVNEDESYGLAATSGKQVVLQAATVVGAMRGLETLLQWVSGDAEGFFVPAGQIQDRPRFKWRGLLIDAGRHFEPVAVIKRELDGMAAVKLNVLHFHLSEDQGFRVESHKFPRLHELGSDGDYYTQDDLRDIIEYARQRGIRVVPEFDMPGHVTSWVVGYPELASAPGPYTIARGFGVFDPAFDPTRETTYKFIDTFIGEMVKIFPDPYWHIGGDENNGKQWAANPKIQAFMKEKGIADAHGLQTYFNQRLLAILKKHGKRMMGWDEIFQPGLPKETVVHSWRGQKSLFDAAKQGYDGVLSAGYYIDLLETAARHYAVDPLPANSGLTDAEAAHILGGEATMWGEWVSPETIDSRIWPRAAAIAERFWSPREVSDIDDMYRRLDRVSIELEELGLTHERNGDVLLRRLAGSRDVGALRVLANVVEPVKGYTRGSQQRWTTLGPLTHLVDAVSTDSPGAREVRQLIDGLLSDMPRFAVGRERLRAIFTEWRDSRPALDALVARAPALKEVAPLSADLADLGAVGLDALAALALNATPLDAWRDERVAVLDRAARPKAALEFPFVPVLRELVFGAMAQAEMKTLPVADWRARVRALANPPRRGRGAGFPQPAG